MLTNLMWAHGQCTIATAESEDKKVWFQKAWGMKIKNNKQTIEINIVRLDTVDTKDKPCYYLTVAADSLGNETINAIDQLTLRIENQKQIVLESKKVTLPENAFIFADSERFFRLETTIFDQITKDLLMEIQFKDNVKQEITFYTVDKKKFAHQARCIKNAW